MVTQEIQNLILSKRIEGLSDQEIREKLVEMGYNLADVNEGLNPNLVSHFKYKKLIPVAIMFILVAWGMFFYTRLDPGPEVVTPLSITPKPVNVLVTDANCEAFPKMLSECKKYKCQFTHPVSGNLMIRDIVGLGEAGCRYEEEMPESELSCTLSEEMRKAVAKYYSDGAIYFYSDAPDNGKRYKISENEVMDPLQWAIESRQCDIENFNYRG